VWTDHEAEHDTASPPSPYPCLATADASSQIAVVRPTVAEPTSSALTDGIRVSVQTHYLADQSSPRDDRYVFAYTITIANEGTRTAQLRTRHWVITDARGVVEEVRGDGVVGEQPRLTPGQSFEYTSGCVLTTPIGTMHGTYRMWRDDSTYFDAVIAPFSLAAPGRVRHGADESN
jgi:ApaG protein